MQKTENLYNQFKQDSFDEKLSLIYTNNNIDLQKERYTNALFRFGKIYGWDRPATVYRMPMGLALAGDGCDMAVALNVDIIGVVSKNNVNVSRLQARDYFGEDNIDVYQKGPYAQELNTTSGVLRGMQQAFMHYGYEVYGVDIYIDGDTLPESGLQDPTQLAGFLGQIFNLEFNEGKLTDIQISLAVQWALCNYFCFDTLPVATLSALQGKNLTVNFENIDTPNVELCDVNFEDFIFFTLDTTQITIIDDYDETEKMLKENLSKFKIDMETFNEDEFFKLITNNQEKTDIQFILFMLDYFTQDNMFKIYDEAFVEGLGSPLLKGEKQFTDKEHLGSSIWRNKIYHPYNLSLYCCNKNNIDNAIKVLSANLDNPKIKIVGYDKSGFTIIQ